MKEPMKKKITNTVIRIMILLTILSISLNLSSIFLNFPSKRYTTSMFGLRINNYYSPFSTSGNGHIGFLGIEFRKYLDQKMSSVTDRKSVV